MAWRHRLPCDYPIQLAPSDGDRRHKRWLADQWQAGAAERAAAREEAWERAWEMALGPDSERAWPIPWPIAQPAARRAPAEAGQGCVLVQLERSAILPWCLLRLVAGYFRI